MPVHLARASTALLLVALFFGTLMPGSWKDAALDPLQSPVDLAATAHVVLFCAISFTLPQAEWWNARVWHVLAIGLALALLTEGLQFFAIDRHPNLAGIRQDMAGALMGQVLLLTWRRRMAARNLHRG